MSAAQVLTLHEDFEFVDTGDVIEEPYNAVMIEDVVTVDDAHVHREACSAVAACAPIGEDIVAGLESLFTAGLPCCGPWTSAPCWPRILSVAVLKARAGIIPRAPRSSRLDRPWKREDH